ncbi:MAG: hypothetical protein ACRD2D_00710 [Terriglobales bacterium]
MKRSQGFWGGALAGDLHEGNWTVTVWQDHEAMLRFRHSGSHLKALRQLMHWCDEAWFTHWNEAEAIAPDAETAYACMRADGRLSKVRNPSPLQRAGNGSHQ